MRQTKLDQHDQKEFSTDQGVKRYYFNFITMASESSQQTTSVLVPDFDGPVCRTTGKQITGIKYDFYNPTSMASESPQQTTSVFVPDFDGLIKGTTG